MEGTGKEALEKLLMPFADGKEPPVQMALTKSDFYALGLSGGADSAALRAALEAELDLPTNLSANSLLAAVNLLISENEFTAALKKARNIWKRRNHSLGKSRKKTGNRWSACQVFS